MQPAWDSKKVSAGANVDPNTRCRLPTLGAARTCSAPSENSWEPPEIGNQDKQFDGWVVLTDFLIYNALSINGFGMRRVWLTIFKEGN